MALPFAIPFAFAGAILGVLLASRDASARRVYFFDLAGSALGAFAVIGAISGLGVEHSVLAASAFMLASAAVLFPPRSKTSWIALAVGMAALALGTGHRDRIFAIKLPAAACRPARRSSM